MIRTYLSVVYSLIILMFLMCTLLFAPLRAEDGAGFYSSRLFLEIKGGQGFEFGGSPMNQINLLSSTRTIEPDTYLSAMGMFAQFSGTIEEKAWSLYVFDNAPDPEFRSELVEFLFEYGLSDNFGLGFTLHHEEYRAQDLSFDKGTIFFVSGINVVLGNPLQLTTQQMIELDIISPLITFNYDQQLRINTFDFNFAYHFISHSAFDPYARIIGGYGEEDRFNYKITHAGLALGFRYFFSSGFYGVMEITGNKYDVNHNSTSWTIKEAAGSVGVGYAF